MSYPTLALNVSDLSELLPLFPKTSCHRILSYKLSDLSESNLTRCHLLSNMTECQLKSESNLTLCKLLSDTFRTQTTRVSTEYGHWQKASSKSFGQLSAKKKLKLHLTPGISLMGIYDRLDNIFLVFGTDLGPWLVIFPSPLKLQAKKVHLLEKF